MKANKDCDLILKTKIWDNDNHELIDYDNKDTIKKTFKINTSGILSRIGNEIIFSNETSENSDECREKLLEIIKKENNKYILNCGNWSKDLLYLSKQTGAYMIFKSDFFKEEKKVKNKFYKLSQGDIIKLGRIYIKLLDMQLEEETNIDNNYCINSNFNEKKLISNLSYNTSIEKGQELIKGSFFNNCKLKVINNLSNSKSNEDNLLFLSIDNKLKNKCKNKSNDHNNFFLPRINSCGELFMVKPKTSCKNKKSNKNNKNYNEKKINIKNNICRICYGENSKKENPLLCPCICKGSMKYIHYICLKSWINSKIESEYELNSKENSTISYNKKDICCELCMTQFPDYIRYKGVLYNIAFYKPKFKEFIMFETLREDKNKSKYINIVSLENKKMINIGRSRDCEFSIPEISISRFHSIIHKNKSELYIEDNKSKFGTLILVQNDNIEINSDNPLKLQIARTYLKIKKNCSFLSYSCCNANTNNGNEKNDYQNQNKQNLNVFSYFNIKDNNNIDADYEEKSMENLTDNNLNENEINVKYKINNEKILISSEDNQTNEKNYFEKNILAKNGIEKKINAFINNNNESLNNMQIYKKNKFNNIKNFETNNNITNNSKNDVLHSKYISPETNNKKNNFNLIIEDSNNKFLLGKGISNKNFIKMKKIKITQNTNNLIINKEYCYPNIKNEFKPLENFLYSSLNENNLQSIQNKKAIYLIDRNINSNIFNLNKPKHIINRNNSIINSNKKIISDGNDKIESE